MEDNQTTQNKEKGKIEKETIFEKRIKPLLMYIGTIGAIFMVIAYISIVLVMIFGFKVKSIKQSFIFATVNGIVGFIIMQLLKIQGIDFAKQLDENKKVLKAYYLNNDCNGNVRKFKSINDYWKISIVKDILGKVLTLIFTSCLIIYIVIEGSNDYSMLLLAFVNLVMFICFGLLSLVNAYDFFNNEHIPYIQYLMSKRANEPLSITIRINEEHAEKETVVKKDVYNQSE